MTKRTHIRIVEKKLKDDHGIAYRDEPLIEIDPRQRRKQFLNTLVHELIHKADYSMSEKQVRKIARVIADHLWDMRYRRIY